jgi:hypothetical protein
MRKLFTILLLFQGISLPAQDLQYARKIVDTLCSEAMNGRGYVNRGDHAAASFIAETFSKAGLKKFSKTHFQNFTTAVNTFPGKMKLTVNNTYDLVPGSDFLISPGSPGIKGTFGTIKISAPELLQESAWLAKVKAAEGKFIVIENFDKRAFESEQLKKINEVISFLEYNDDNPARGTLIMTNDKLTWSGATTRYTKPSFTINTTAFKEPINEIMVDIDNEFIKKYETQNVIGYLKGESNDSILVYTAHYDHLGMMGRGTMFPGANDNASGVAMLLALVQYYVKHPPEYTTVFIAFGSEEIGLVGSAYFTDNPLFPLSKIKFLINFDMAGTGDDGIQVVNGKIYQKKFDLLTQINTERSLVKQIKIRGEACNSDHCMFHRKGVPCFFIYTLGGIQAYHDINDKAQTLPLTDFEDYFQLVIEFIRRI